MKTITVVYHSGTGHTAKMADAVAKGAASVAGIQVKMARIEGKDILEGRYQNEDLLARLDASEALIFGSPTYMGGPSAQFKAFADATAERWFGRKWRNKIAAGFSVSGGPSGDKLNTLEYFAIFAAQHGMIWVGNDLIPYGDPQGRNRLSSYLGVMGQAGQEPTDLAPNEADKLTAEALGRRVAEVLLKLP